MAKVKFYRGTKAKYNSTTHADGIYFATDTKEVILNGNAYGKETDISGKQDVITDLATIRSGAALGTTSLQPSDLLNDDIIINGYKAVDLGITLANGKHLLWAACNVGAETETDYGKYFQWGDTVGYTDASHSTWSTAPFNNGSSDYNSTYFASVKDTVCPNNVLALQYDAANVNMGGNWKMPTKEYMQQLLNKTRFVWTTINGVNGRKFISNTDSSKYIFIPASGFVSEGSIKSRGRTYLEWSSSLDDILMPWIFEGDSDEKDIRFLSRVCGLSVRGVLELTDEELEKAKTKFYTKSEIDTKLGGALEYETNFAIGKSLFLGDARIENGNLYIPNAVVNDDSITIN